MKKLVSVLIAFAMILTCAAFAEVELTLQGNAQLTVPADIATISINVCVRDESAVAAQTAANEKIAAVREACTVAGVAAEDITVDCIRVNVYDDSYGYSDDAEGAKMYEASTSVTVRVNDMTLAGSVIDAAIAAGADNIYGANFSLSDPKAYSAQVMEAAVADARAKADTLAASMGLKVTGVKCVTETYSDSYESSVAAFTDSAAREENAKTDMGTASITVYETLQITFIAE